MTRAGSAWLASILTVTVETVRADTPHDINIGVLSHRGDEVTLRKWTPTADYLSSALPDYRFRIKKEGKLPTLRLSPCFSDSRCTERVEQQDA